MGAVRVKAGGRAVVDRTGKARLQWCSNWFRGEARLLDAYSACRGAWATD